MGNGIMAGERQAGRKPTSRRTDLDRQSRHEKATGWKITENLSNVCRPFESVEHQSRAAYWVHSVCNKAHQPSTQQSEPLGNNMSRILALGIVALAIFTGIAKGEEGGGGDFKPGVNPRTISSKLIGADQEVHMLVAKSVEENGDYVMTIQKSKNSKEWLGVKGDVVDWGVGKPAEWVLHKNTAGWSIMLKSDKALAISLNEKKDGLVLQRNQGEKHQLWEIEKQK